MVANDNIMQDFGLKICLSLLVCMAACGLAPAGMLPVNVAEQADWIDYLSPLPKEISIKGRQIVAVTNITIQCRPDAGMVAKQAALELRELLNQPTEGVPVTGNERLTIALGLADAGNCAAGIYLPEIDRLRQLPNRDQAYLIRPTDDRTLLIAALNEKGLYYGIQTLKQLVMPFLKNNQAVIPMAVVTDWPDLEERGLWNIGLDTPGMIPWLASLKMNFTHASMGVVFKKGEKTLCPPLPSAAMECGKMRAFLVMPHMTHLDFFDQYGFDGIYPELYGQGESALHPHTKQRGLKHRCPCPSKPQLTQIIADWLNSAAEQGAREVSIWLTEFQPCYCSCEACLAAGGSRQLQLETAVSLKAIREARTRYPDMVVRIFFTTMGKNRDRDDIECLALLPDDGSVKSEVVYGRHKVFDERAAAGKWVATYTGAGVLGHAWSAGRGAFRLQFYPGPETIRNTIRSYVDARYSALYTPSAIATGGSSQKGFVEMNLCRYHINMLAEWSWNANGRNARQFNRAWVARRGYADREKALQCLDILWPAEDVLFRLMSGLGGMCGAISRGQALELGKSGGFETIMTETQFDELPASARKGVRIAEALDASDLIAESRFVEAAFEMLKGVRQLSLIVSEKPGADAPLAGEIQKITGAIDRMLAAADQQANTWSDMPAILKQQFAEHTRDYWKSQLQAIQQAVEKAPGVDKK